MAAIDLELRLHIDDYDDHYDVLDARTAAMTPAQRAAREVAQDAFSARTDKLRAIVIRRAAVTDAPAVLIVRNEAIRFSSAGVYPREALEAWASGCSLDRIRRRIATSAGFVAVDSGAVVGWASLDGHEVDQLYVTPTHGAQGVARGLYGAIEQYARERSIAILRTTASLRSEPAFRRFGFAEERRFVDEFDGHMCEVVRMWKRLD